jgi:hypothetical protein
VTDSSQLVLPQIALPDEYHLHRVMLTGTSRGSL